MRCGIAWALCEPLVALMPGGTPISGKALGILAEYLSLVFLCN